MIYFEEYGDKKNKTIMLLHGAGLTPGTTFHKQYPVLDKYHIIAPHLLGAGRETGAEYTHERQLMLLEELTESIDADKIILIGYDLGAELAIALVNKIPKRFEKAVFLSPKVCVSAISQGYGAVKVTVKNTLIKMKPFAGYFAKKYDFNEEQTAEFYACNKAFDPDNYQAWHLSKIKLEECIHYKFAELPMIVVCGEKEDGEVRISAAELSNNNPNCVMKIMKDRDKYYMFNDSGVFNEALTEFLEREIPVIRVTEENEDNLPKGS